MAWTGQYFILYMLNLTDQAAGFIGDVFHFFSPTLCIYSFDNPFNKLKAFEVLVFQFLHLGILCTFFVLVSCTVLFSFCKCVTLFVAVFFFPILLLFLCFIVKRYK